MSIVRSYFLKNNTLIGDNSTNNSQNPVTEISYGTANKQVSRFIFDVDLNTLFDKYHQGYINPGRIVKHVLHMTNTIRYAPDYLGKKSYSLGINRATAFDLELVNIDEDWSEGSGYDFVYDDTMRPDLLAQASNWYSGTTGVAWTVPGAYNTGTTQIIATQRFEKGSENIEIDVTDYINQRVFDDYYSGTTAYTGNSFGLMIKFPDYIEELETEFREAVAFHAKNTNTFYEPYIETIIDDKITDDRNYFFMDKDNELYLYVNVGNIVQNIHVNSVTIRDYQGNIYTVLSGDSIINVNKGIYKIVLNIDSTVYPDAVLFTDEWDLVVNGRNVTYSNEFYLISSSNYYTFDLSNQIDTRNYHFNFWGISEREKIIAGGLRKVRLSIKELYPNQNKFIPLDIEYRIFTTVGSKYELDIIPFTSVNRTSNGYEFDIDTSWLVSQDYYLQIRMKNGNYYDNKQTLMFTVVNDKLFN